VIRGRSAQARANSSKKYAEKKKGHEKTGQTIRARLAVWQFGSGNRFGETND